MAFNFSSEINESKSRFYEVINREAAKKKPTKNDPLMIPFFSGMLSPYVDSQKRGALIGLSLDHTASDLIFSVFESVAFAIRLNLDHIMKYVPDLDCLIVSGGGSSSDTWCQIKADVTGLPIKRVKEKDTSLVGAAILGAVATGLYEDIDDCSESFVKIDHTFYPSSELMDHYSDRYDRFKHFLSIIEP
jgi:xylulokinase